VVAANQGDGQGSNPVLAAGSDNAYVVWGRYPFPGTMGGYGNTIGFAVVYVNNNARDGSDIVLQRSTDDDVTFSSSLVLNSRPADSATGRTGPSTPIPGALLGSSGIATSGATGSRKSAPSSRAAQM
jgi:hypothetical protein